LTAKRAAKLSVPSSTMSTPPTAASSAAPSRRSASATTSTPGFNAVKRFIAASTFSVPTSSSV